MRGNCRLSLLAAGAALAWGLSGALVPQAEAADLTIKLGWTSSAGETDPYAIGARAFKQAVEAESKGRIEVQLFPNRPLGDEKPMLEGMRLGTVDAAIITNAVVAQIEPAFQLNDLPFLYSDEAQAQKHAGRPGRRQAAQASWKPRASTCSASWRAASAT